MEFRVEEITDKNVWEEFLLNCQQKSFLQSWNWGGFQKLSDNKIWRFGLYSYAEKTPKRLISVALIVKISARRGTFLFIPHGPVIKNEDLVVPEIRQKLLSVFGQQFILIANQEKADFLRVAPVWLNTPENDNLFKSLGFVKSATHMHAEVSWELDISPTEEQLLGQMRKTTRYLIRQARKNPDITITKSTEKTSLEAFQTVYRETVDRHRFVPFSRSYLNNELEAFSADNQAVVFLGKYQGEVISAALIIYWSKGGYYHQGASSSKYGKIPVSYLLQWEAIKEAKSRGCQRYNFWGISDTNNAKHPWFGLSQFKMGFGGYRQEYVKTLDLPLTKKYWLIHLFEACRKRIRGL